MEELTESQNIIFNAIKEFIEEYGYSPTVREIAGITKRHSPATVHAAIKILKRKGYIDYEYNKNRTLRIVKEDSDGKM